MPLVLLPNTAWAVAAQTDIQTVAGVSIASEAPYFGSLAGGPRSLSYTQTADTDDRKFIYINKAGTLDCTHVVWARADLHNNGARGVQIVSYSNYPSVSATEFSTGVFSQTLVGKNMQDWVFPLSASGKQALALNLTTVAYTKQVAKLFFSKGITFNYPQQVTTKHLPFPSRYIYRRQAYLIDEAWQFTFENMTRAEVAAFEAVPNLLSEPLFLYDAAGTQIPYKLIHGIISDHQVTQIHNDNHTLTLTMDALRQWA